MSDTEQSVTEKQPDIKQDPVEEQQSEAKSANIVQSLKNIPSKISTDIEEGKGNTVIVAIQNAINTGINSIFSSCRIIILQQLLLPEKTKDKIAKTIYVIAFILFVVEVFMIVFDCSIANICLAAECLLAAAIADNILHKGTATKKRKTRSDEYL